VRGSFIFWDVVWNFLVADSMRTGWKQQIDSFYQSFGAVGADFLDLHRLKPSMPEEIHHLRTEDPKIVARLKKAKKPQTEPIPMNPFSLRAINRELSRNSGNRNSRGHTNFIL
jgi:hypothetical protein